MRMIKDLTHKYTPRHLPKPKRGKTYEAWGVILDFTWLVAAALTQDEARELRDAFLKRAKESHRPVLSVAVELIRAKRV